MGLEGVEKSKQPVGKIVEEQNNHWPRLDLGPVIVLLMGLFDFAKFGILSELDG